MNFNLVKNWTEITETLYGELYAFLNAWRSYTAVSVTTPLSRVLPGKLTAP